MRDFSKWFCDTGCGHIFFTERRKQRPFCPNCGEKNGLRRIEDCLLQSAKISEALPGQVFPYVQE